MKQVFHPYCTHCLTVYPNGNSKRLEICLWNGDDMWPKSFQITYKWKNVVYWHIWFFGLFRNKCEEI